MAVAVPVTVVVVLAGTWLTSGELTDDASAARLLTGAWFGLAGLLALLVAFRWRQLAAALIGAWLVTSVVAGGYLLLTSTVDQVADDPVARALAEETAAGSQGGPSVEGQGRFADGAHPTEGTAQLLRKPDGRRVLALTGFATDPGPDLRVVLVSDPTGKDVGGGIDLGALKGNTGDQVYPVPPDADGAAVVIWCRAFTVAFGTASLAAA